MNTENKRKNYFNARPFSYETIKTEEDCSAKDTSSLTLFPFMSSQDSESKESIVKDQAPEFHSVMSSQNSFRSFQKPPDFNHYELAPSPYMSLDDYFRPHSVQPTPSLQPSLDSAAATQALMKMAATSLDPLFSANTRPASTETSNNSAFAFKAALPEPMVCTCPCTCGARPNVKTEIPVNKSPVVEKQLIKEDKKGTKQNVARNIPGLIFGRVKARCRKCLRLDEGDLSDDEEHRVEYIMQVWREEKLDENAKKHFFAFIDVANVQKNKTWSSVEENCMLDKKSAMVVLKCVEGFLSDKGHKDFESWIESGTKMSADVKTALREKKADFLKDFKKITVKVAKLASRNPSQ